jgi:hypothetical protein
LIREEEWREDAVVLGQRRMQAPAPCANRTRPSDRMVLGTAAAIASTAVALSLVCAVPLDSHSNSASSREIARPTAKTVRGSPNHRGRRGNRGPSIPVLRHQPKDTLKPKDREARESYITPWHSGPAAVEPSPEVTGELPSETAPPTVLESEPMPTAQPPPTPPAVEFGL